MMDRSSEQYKSSGLSNREVMERHPERYIEDSSVRDGWRLRTLKERSTMGLNAPGPAPKGGRKDAPASAPPKAPRATAVKANGEAATEGPLCTCGCGGHTKGGRFLPGHDARYHSAQRAAERAAAEAKTAETLTGKKGGRAKTAAK